MSIYMPTTAETEARKLYFLRSAIDALYLENDHNKALVWVGAVESIVFGAELPPEEFLSALTWMTFDHVVVLEAFTLTGIGTLDPVGIDNLRQNILRRLRLRLDPEEIKQLIRDLISTGLIDLEDGDLLSLTDSRLSFLRFVGWR